MSCRLRRRDLSGGVERHGLGPAEVFRAIRKCDCLRAGLQVAGIPDPPEGSFTAASQPETLELGAAQGFSVEFCFDGAGPTFGACRSKHLETDPIAHIQGTIRM